jgi:hypothetical protein
MSGGEFSRKLKEELLRYPVFTLYWNESLDGCMPERIPLSHHPTDTIGYFEYSSHLQLFPREPGGVQPQEISVSCELHFTSTAPEFDFEEAVKVDSPNHAQIHAVNVTVQIKPAGDCIAATFKKTLWSVQPSWVDGRPEFVRLFL